MDILTVFMFFGGLGLFLYGMQVMQEGLEKTAGDNMRTLLEKQRQILSLVLPLVRA